MFRQTSAETLVIKDYSNFRSYSSAAISIVVVCHIQDGVPVIVKWEEGHAVMVDLHTLSILACSSGVIIKSSRPTFTKA